MLKYLIIIIISTNCCILVYSQNYESFQIKEQYDNLSDLVVPDSYIEPPRPSGFTERLGRVSDFLTSQIRLFQTTNDKSYLIKFINNCLLIQSYRNDVYYDPSDHPGWMLIGTEAENNNMYLDGLGIMPMAEFVYMLKNNSELYITPLPQSLVNIPPVFASVSFQTYGDFANWLRNRIEETIDWYINTNNGYWDDDYGFKKLPEEEYAAEINMQSGFATALIFLGLSYTDYYDIKYADYRAKAVKIVDLYKSNVSLFRDSDCDLPVSECFSLNVLQTFNNSYWWYHSGWSQKPTPNPWCSNDRGKCSEYKEFIDDISHGAKVLFFPKAIYENYSTILFTEYDMIKWRNMFTENIYDGSGEFYCAVNGTDGPIFTGHGNAPDPNCPNFICPHSYLKMRSLAYMPLYKFDELAGGGNNVYDVVMNFYVNYVNDATFQTYEMEGLDYLGLSETVVAQWDKECPNLTLNNREVMYNQDFFAKGNLIVAPEESNGKSYADPVIQEQEFTVEPGVSVNISSSGSITLKKGTHIKSGSYFRAYIDPTLCDNNVNTKISYAGDVPDNDQSGRNAYIQDKNEVVAEQKPEPAGELLISICPNPSDGLFYVSAVNYSGQEMQVFVMDMLGKTVFTGNNASGSFVIDLSQQPAGLYYVNINAGGELFSEKVVVK
ncbi:MAG: T9SS type A sorting domain-containing protein [Bacteroidota bacterium]